jgi:hypothetical protein
VKKQTVSSLKKKLDKVFSEWIRNKYANSDGYVICCTCGVRKYWKEMQNSHYISRSHNSTRYLEKNCHPACVGCNIFKSGNIPEYTLFLQKKYGNDIIKELVKESRKIKQFTCKELQEKIEEYKTKTRELLENY